MSTIARTDNRSVVHFAIAGRDAEGYGNHHTRHTPAGIFAGGYMTGALSNRLASILRMRAEYITQVIYSYNTPIAWLDGDTWIIPDVRYSVTTSKHQGYLWRLQGDIGNRRSSVPWDISYRAYMRILERKMYYVAHSQSFFPGPNFTLNNKDL